MVAVRSAENSSVVEIFTDGKQIHVANLRMFDKVPVLEFKYGKKQDSVTVKELMHIIDDAAKYLLKMK